MTKPEARHFEEEIELFQVLFLKCTEHPNHITVSECFFPSVLYEFQSNITLFHQLIFFLDVYLFAL